jgi:cytosine/adenosine deaminase-related metal-dependent hydrolase
MDPATGDVFDGDVLVEDDEIVGSDLEIGDAEVVDAAGCILIPGFIDSHRHTWETVIRGVAPDVGLAGYSTSCSPPSRRPTRRTSMPATTWAHWRRSARA